MLGPKAVGSAESTRGSVRLIGLLGIKAQWDNAPAILRRASPIPRQDASLLNALTTVTAAQPDND